MRYSWIKKRLAFGRKLKKMLPKSLLTRMLLIIIVPTILAQVISSYMFYKRHWDNVKKYMIYTLAGEIALISKMHDLDSNVEVDKFGKIDVYTFLQYHFKKDKTLPQITNKLSKELNILKSNIQYNLPDTLVNIEYNKKLDLIIVNLEMNGGLFTFEISKNRIFASSTHIFLLWMVGSTMVLLTLTILFAKNQIKSITKLSIAADKLSKGAPVGHFTPQGATEVKRAGEAIIRMKEKIEHQVQQKAKMLAGVSHDLRTPITRLKLELEIMKKDSHTSGIREDITQMENTINDYLEFAKGDDNSTRTLLELGDLFGKLKKLYAKRLNIKVKIDKKIYLELKQNQFKRAISNLLDNAQRFASKVQINLYEKNQKVFVEIHDNGPGIPKAEIKKVLEPFYRVDASRNQNSGGVGLGMSISQEIIEQHKGTLALHRSTALGGLMILITIPSK